MTWVGNKGCRGMFIAVLAGTGVFSGCVCGPGVVYDQAYMPRGGGAGSCGPCVASPCETSTYETASCDPCQGNTMSYGVGGSCGYAYGPLPGQPLRTSATCIESGLNTAGNLVAGVITFPIHLASGLVQGVGSGAGAYYGGCGCSREVYYGDYGYQQQDFCNPCVGSVGALGPRVVGGAVPRVVRQSDCGCQGGVPAEMPSVTEADISAAAQRPTSRVVAASAYQPRLSPTRTVTTASFSTPMLRPLPVR